MGAVRGALTGLAVVGLAGGLLAVGTATGAPRGAAPAVPEPAGTRSAATRPVADRTDPVAALQADLRRVPRHPEKWSDLGMAYVAQARLTADPGLYAKADGAFDRSLRLRPRDNDAALTGRAALAAARHEFAEALRLARASLAVNAYSATTYGVQVDALTELGRYDEALAAARRMLDLRPGTDTYARLSYAFELRGDAERARLAMEQALQDATVPADRAFAGTQLAELALTSGDVAGARGHVARALAADPAFLPALAGRARVAAAAGDSTAALADYREVVARLPQPAYVLELGELLQATGQAAAAREQYAVVRATQQAFAAAGSDVDLELALFEADHGDPATAVRLAGQVHRARPRSVLVQDAYAWALHRAGRSEQALPLARSAVRLGTPLPALHAHLGLVESAAGDRAAARRHLRRALDSPALSPLLARAAREALQALP